MEIPKLVNRLLLQALRRFAAPMPSSIATEAQFDAPAEAAMLRQLGAKLRARVQRAAANGMGMLRRRKHAAARALREGTLSTLHADILLHAPVVVLPDPSAKSTGSLLIRFGELKILAGCALPPPPVPTPGLRARLEILQVGAVVLPAPDERCEYCAMPNQDARIID